jgi:hypothetical protein
MTSIYRQQEERIDEAIRSFAIRMRRVSVRGVKSVHQVGVHHVVIYVTLSGMGSDRRASMWKRGSVMRSISVSGTGDQLRDGKWVP